MNGRPREEDDDRPTMVAKDDDFGVFGLRVAKARRSSVEVNT